MNNAPHPTTLAQLHQGAADVREASATSSPAGFDPHQVIIGLRRLRQEMQAVTSPTCSVGNYE